MTKMPFGGHDPREAFLDSKSDPEPLLAEIAQCAVEGRAMRPQLARWFHHAWSKKRIRITFPRGASALDSIDARYSAVLSVNELMQGGMSLENAAARVKSELKLRASTTSIKAWTREHKEDNRSMSRDDYDTAQDGALAQLRALRLRGFVGDEAIARLELGLDMPVFLRPEELDRLAAIVGAE